LPKGPKLSINTLFGQKEKGLLTREFVRGPVYRTAISVKNIFSAKALGTIATHKQYGGNFEFLKIFLFQI
jgi:hypothetical protein